MADVEADLDRLVSNEGGVKPGRCDSDGLCVLVGQRRSGYFSDAASASMNSRSSGLQGDRPLTFWEDDEGIRGL